MKAFSRFLILTFLALAAAARAQTPADVQNMIANGQPNAALASLNTILAAHPHSGTAWYLTAEAQDALGHEGAARDALAQAEQYAPGLPFADPSKVAQLQAHLYQNGAVQAHGHPFLLLLAGLFVLYFFFRLLTRRRAAYGYRPGFNAGYPAPPTGGGGIFSSLLGGLAAGAGFAAGERIIDDLTNRTDGQAFGQDPTPNWDDGLNGSPGWDDPSSGSNDSNSW